MLQRINKMLHGILDKMLGSDPLACIERIGAIKTTEEQTDGRV